MLRSPLRILALAGAVMVVGCNSSGTGSQIDDTLSSAGQSGAASQGVDEFQDPRAYCPTTVMRAGTETLDVHPDGMRPDDPDAATKLRFRGTIRDVVRECNSAGSFLNIRVGVAGRVVSGPKGETGSFLMPIRIAVTRGEDVLYSQLHDVPATIAEGTSNAQFSFVDSAISIPKPENRNIIIYVGYDEQRVDLPASQGARRIN